MESVIEWTRAPRRAARSASSPQPVPISRTRLPSPTPVTSSSRSILRPWASSRLASPVAGSSGRPSASASKSAGRVAHGRVEEQLEQLVRQVVVVGDELAGLLLVGPVEVGALGDHERAGALQPVGDQGRHLGREHGEEVAEVLRLVGVPGAGEVGLAEADQAVAADPGVELVGAVDPHRRARRGRGPRADRDRSRSRRSRPAARPRPGTGCARSGTRSSCAARRAARTGRASRALKGRVGLRVIAGTPLPGGGAGRGRIGSLRSHSQTPCARISSALRSAAGAARHGLASVASPRRVAVKRCRRLAR